MLTNAIEFVLRGGVFIPSKLLAESQREGFFSETARSLPHLSSNAPKLTDRQKDVLMLLAKGAPIKRICLATEPRPFLQPAARATASRSDDPAAQALRPRKTRVPRGLFVCISPFFPFASPPLRFPSRAGPSTKCGIFTTLLLACSRYDTYPRNTTFFLICSH